MSDYDALDWLYDEWVSVVTEDIPFYVELVQRSRSERGRDPDVIELGAGSGRITLPLLQADARVRAVDTSQVQLDRLQLRCEAAGLNDRLRWECADAVEFLHGQPSTSCDLIVAPFRMLLHMVEQRDALLQQVRRVLRPRGVFAFDLLHPSAELLGVEEAWQERCSFADLETPDVTWTARERARYNEAADHVALDLHFIAQRPSGALVREVRTCLQLQGSSVSEWRSALQAAGIGVERIDGWFDGLPYRDGDADSVWVTRSP